MSIHIGGVLANGPTEDDVVIHYDEAVSGLGYSFDDMTPITPLPIPSLPGATGPALVLVMGLLALALARHRLRA
jgi:hypothetical protein